MKKAFLWWAVALMLVASTSATVVINQVLYNPSGTESGGEAVELYNSGNSAVDISGWFIATEASMKDASIPKNTFICPGCYYLIADEGWQNSKDSLSMPDADHEEPISLYNSDSGVALLSGSEIVDAAGWGDPLGIDEGLYEGIPSSGASEGKSILRNGDTGNNIEDFSETEPELRSSSSSGGLTYSVDAGISFEIVNNTPEKIVSISISPSSLSFGRINAGEEYVSSILITNTGNTEVDIGIMSSGFNSSSSSVGAESMIYSFGEEYKNIASNTLIEDINLTAGSSVYLSLKLTAPGNSSKGEYFGRIRITATESI